MSAFASVCKKYDVLVAGEYDGFVVGGNVRMLIDHRFQRSTDVLDPLVAFVGFDELNVVGLLKPLTCRKIALVNTDSELSSSETMLLFEQFATAMRSDLKISGSLTSSSYGQAFRLSSPFQIKK